MSSLYTFIGSLAEPIRLAFIGIGLIMGAMVLRKLLPPGQHTLDASAKVEARRGM